MDIAAFRTSFPEFSDTATYPDAQITFWATIAEKQVVQCIWTDLWSFGVNLFVAHEITMAAQNAKTAAIGGIPGQMGGVPTQKAVGAVSVQYDAATTTYAAAGWWNMTNYGKQFYRFVLIFGAGAIQL